MKKTLLAIAAVAFLAGCSSSPKVNEFGIVENAEVTVKKAGPEETWAEFAGAVERNRADVVKELLAQGVSPNTLVEDGDPALVRAIRMDNQPVIKVLLAAPDIDVNTQSRLGEDALMLAAFKGDKELFNTLLARGAKVNKSSGWTALHYAAAAGHLEFVQILIAQGADVNVQTRAGVTPLYMAARMPSRKVVMELLKNGAFRDLCTDRGESPADAARRMGDEELAKYLAVEKCVRPAARPFQTELPTISSQPKMIIHLPAAENAQKK